MGHYMIKEERIILQTLLDEKRPVSYIARKLGCCRQTTATMTSCGTRRSAASRSTTTTRPPRADP